MYHFSLVGNVLRLCEEADFGAQNCQYTTKVDARHYLQLTTSPTIDLNACYQPFFYLLIRSPTLSLSI